MTSPTLNVSLSGMRKAADSASQMMRTLANEDRLLLLCHLAQGEANVGDIEQAVDIHQPTLSQQLGVLRNEGLVSTRREGKYIYYRISDDKALYLVQALYQLYCTKECM